MIRVEATANDSDVLVSSFKDPNSSKLVLIIVNLLAVEKFIKFEKATGSISPLQKLATHTTPILKNFIKA